MEASGGPPQDPAAPRDPHGWGQPHSEVPAPLVYSREFSHGGSRSLHRTADHSPRGLDPPSDLARPAGHDGLWVGPLSPATAGTFVPRGRKGCRSHCLTVADHTPHTSWGAPAPPPFCTTGIAQDSGLWALTKLRHCVLSTSYGCLPPECHSDQTCLSSCKWQQRLLDGPPCVPHSVCHMAGAPTDGIGGVGFLPG